MVGEMKIKHLFFYFTFLFLCIQSLHAAPIVGSVSPAQGDIVGGNVVTLNGFGFTGATSVDFGPRPASLFVVVDDNTITATVPTGTVGTVNVIVTGGGASLPAPSNYYTYTTASWQGIVSGTTPNQLGFFGTDTETFDATIPLTATSITAVISPNGERIYTGNSVPPGISVIDAATNTIITTVPTLVGPGGFAIAINPSGSRVYLTNFNSGYITVFDTATNTIITDIFLGQALGNVSVTPDGSTLYVGDFSSGSVTIIDAATNTILNTLFVGFFPGLISFTPDGTKAFVPVAVDHTVVVIDVSSQMIVNTIPLPVAGQPYGSSILPNGTTLYVVNISDDTVSVIDVASETLTTMISLGAGSGTFWIASTPDSKKAFVINEINDQVYPIETTTNTVGTPFSGIGGNLQDLVISPDPAPVAIFTFTPEPVGVPTPFDASSSFSPIGTIAFYRWDFGDGTVVTTASPTISHTYLTLGDFNVVLTVTNSAGTSTAQVYSSRFMSNNGGPTATRSQMVPSLLIPPTDGSGYQKRCKYPTQVDIINVIMWQPSLSSNPVTYEIFRDSLTHLIAVVPGSGPFQYFDHNRHKNVTYTYYIVAVTASGIKSTPIVVTITPKH